MRSRSGEPELLVHTEIQGKREPRFPFRMWQYYSLLRLRTALPVFPVVIYLTPGSGDTRWEEYEDILLGERSLSFRYAVISLPDMAADNWRNLPGVAGALAAALIALMRPGEISRARLKFDGLVRAASGEVNEARLNILATILEMFLPLTNPADASEFSDMLTAESFETGVNMIISPYEERGIRQGMQQGMQQGLQQGQRQMLLHLLRQKFGEVPEAVVARINALTDSEELLMMADRVLTASMLDEVKIP